ncbi:MAG: 4Fe-4S binding protein [Planctomycetota bacterium]|jgi:ferredoxin
MNAQNRARPATPTLGLFWALVIALPMLLLSAMILTQGRPPADAIEGICVGGTWLLFNGLFLLMLTTGKTDRYRSVLFILAAIGLIIFFATEIWGTRGSPAVTEGDAIAGDVPFCHMVIPMILIPAALTQKVIFPGTMTGTFASIASMLVLWTGATIALGRGWCSWVCFYGGLDEGFSRLAKKPRIKRVHSIWTFLPFAVLLAVVLTSAMTLSPTYCEWLCPFKTVTELAAVTSLLILVQTVIFVTLFAVMVVGLPILTKRRTQCGLFCPFGAFQSFFNKTNVFDIRTDPDKCRECGVCVQTCPTFSLDEDSPQRGTPRITCTKCGKCVDVCPSGAVAYHVKGTGVAARPNLARILFIYPASVFLVAMGGGMLAQGLTRIIRWAITGTMS